MRQVWVLHGGNTYDSYEAFLADLRSSSVDYERLKYGTDWKPWLVGQLPGTDVLLPGMPNKQNAQYEAWKIVFEKFIEHFSDDVQLVGHSLGAMFLAKYLQENPLEVPVKRLVLISGAYDSDENEDLGSFGITSATRLPESASEIWLIHSEDDPIVPFTELAKFQADLPEAHTMTFTDRLHLWQETFPELATLLRTS